MSIALLGRIIGDKLGIKPQRVQDAPLRLHGRDLSRLRVGGVLDMSKAAATFITADAAATIFKTPAETHAEIRGYGRIPDQAFVIHRFYFDGPASGDTDTFLQVISKDGHIVEGEVKMFQKLAEVNPATDEEWDLWLKGSAEVAPLLAGEKIQWQDNIEYKRFWNPGPRIGATKHYGESLYSGGNNAYVDLTTMLFCRTLDLTTEWLQLSVCRSGTQRWIEANVGINIDPGELSSI